MSAPLLSIAGLQAGYGQAQVLFGVDLAVAEGEVVSLMGRNGMGKTTTVRALMGLLPASAGRIEFAGRPILGAPPFRIAQAGIGLVPEGRQIFPTLTVEENLIATAASRGERRRAGRCRASIRSCPGLPSAGAISATRSPAASSRCWRSAAHS